MPEGGAASGGWAQKASATVERSEAGAQGRRSIVVVVVVVVAASVVVAVVADAGWTASGLV